MTIKIAFIDEPALLKDLLSIIHISCSFAINDGLLIGL